MLRKSLVFVFVVWILIVPGYSAIEAELGTTDSDAAISFVKVDGEKVLFPDCQPFIESGRTLVPVRFIAEALGFEVEWIQEYKTVTINGGQILLPIDSTTATVNGKTMSLDVPARLVVTDGSTRTYVPLRFISEMLNCTVDWFNENRSIVINSLLPDGKEVSLYHRCKQSELFYERTPKSSKYEVNAEWESELYLKSSLSELTDEACLGSDWVVYRSATYYPGGRIQRENGQDLVITILRPHLKARHEIKEILMTFYPTGHEEVYDILMKTIREEIYENNGILPSTISGTFGTRYIDNREIHINKAYSSLYISIQLKDAGYINLKKPSLYPPDFHDLLISDGVANRGSAGKTYMERYELDKW